MIMPLLVMPLSLSLSSKVLQEVNKVKRKRGKGVGRKKGGKKAEQKKKRKGQE